MKNTSGQLTLCPADGWGEVVPPTALDTGTAENLLKTHESMRVSLLEYSAAGVVLVDALRRVCVAFREAALSPADRRSVLRYAGWNESRISEMGRIVESDKRTFARYMSSAIGYKLALLEARAGVAASGKDSGDKPVVQDLRKFLADYKGHVPVKGSARVTYNMGGFSFKLVVRKIRKAREKTPDLSL